MLDAFVANRLLGIGGPGAEARHAINDVGDQIEYDAFVTRSSCRCLELLRRRSLTFPALVNNAE